MSTQPLGTAFSFFPSSRRHTGEKQWWKDTIETLRQYLLSLNEKRRESLYATAERMIDSRSLRGPKYLKLWFFSHPCYEVFMEFLQDEALCQAFGAYLAIVSNCQSLGNRVSAQRLKKMLDEGPEQVALLSDGYSKLLLECYDGIFDYFQPSPDGNVVLTPYPEVSEQSLIDEMRKTERKILTDEINGMRRTYPQPAWTHEFRRIFDFVGDELLENPITIGSLEGLVDDLIPQVSIGDFSLTLPDTWCPTAWFGSYLRELMAKGSWVKFSAEESRVTTIREVGSITSRMDHELFTGIIERSCSIAHAKSLQLRTTERGLLPVGIKLHCVTKKPPGVEFLTRGNFQAHNAGASFNLPPVGSTKAAADMLQRIEERSGVSFLENPNYQIQVCSPGELSPKNAALLGIGFYLASDPIRRYSQTDFNNTALSGSAGRLIIYGAGVCDLTFDWWDKDEHGKLRVEILQKKLRNRTDVLSCQNMRDIENVNLIATLLMHAQYKGYWAEIGEQFISEMESMLKKHQLGGILDADWVIGWHWSTGQQPPPAATQSFWGALEELMNYAFGEFDRIKHAAESGDHRAAHQGILFEMQQILDQYRAEIELQSS